MKEKLSKIAISNQANKSLASMLEALNKETATKVKKQDLTSFIIESYEKHHFKKNINKIKKETQNPVAYAKSLIKELESTNKSPRLSDIKALFN